MNTKVAVKICGITRLEDAQKAISLGAWALGFIFTPTSPRYISSLLAKRIIQQLPRKVLKIGVFMDQEAQEVRDIQLETGIDAIQLHGDESPSYARALGNSVIRAFEDRFDRVNQFESVMAVLLEASDVTSLESVQTSKPVILAGGLDATNVVAKIQQVKPYAIDLSRGVESRPGIKDHDKLEAFFSVLRKEGFV